MNRQLEEKDLSWLMKTLDKVVDAQRPLVVSHLRNLRKKHPHLTPEQLIKRLEKQYLTAVSAGGAAVGASAVAPGIGTAAALGLTAVETVAFLEASAFFAQAIAEVHGMPIQDPDRAKALVMSLMMGSAGSSLVKRFAEQTMGRGAAGNVFWGQLIASSMPAGLTGQLLERLRSAFLKRMARNAGTGALGRLLPFGIGAVIGGVGNHMFGRQIVSSARDAFGNPPARFTTELDPRPSLSRSEKRAEKRASRKHGEIEQKPLQSRWESMRRSTRPIGAGKPGADEESGTGESGSGESDSPEQR